jgi:hypothetical protein
MDQHKRAAKEEVVITISASKEEWKAVERLITSYRQQCKSMRHHTPMLAHLNRFQERLTKQTGFPCPDDYFI